MEKRLVISELIDDETCNNHLILDRRSTVDDFELNVHVVLYELSSTLESDTPCPHNMGQHGGLGMMVEIYVGTSYCHECPYHAIPSVAVKIGNKIIKLINFLCFGRKSADKIYCSYCKK